MAAVIPQRQFVDNSSLPESQPLGPVARTLFVLCHVSVGREVLHVGGVAHGRSLGPDTRDAISLLSRTCPKFLDNK